MNATTISPIDYSLVFSILLLDGTQCYFTVEVVYCNSMHIAHSVNVIFRKCNFFTCTIIFALHNFQYFDSAEQFPSFTILNILVQSTRMYPLKIRILQYWNMIGIFSYFNREIHQNFCIYSIFSILISFKFFFSGYKQTVSAWDMKHWLGRHSQMQSFFYKMSCIGP